MNIDREFRIPIWPGRGVSEGVWREHRSRQKVANALAHAALKLVKSDPVISVDAFRESLKPIPDVDPRYLKVACFVDEWGLRQVGVSEGHIAVLQRTRELLEEVGLFTVRVHSNKDKGHA